MTGPRRFMVEEVLGEGGMGIVYEALDVERRTRVALKKLRHLSPDSLRRFKGEFRKLQDLHHPNLVSLGEFFEEGGEWFFTMELVRGCHFLLYVRPLDEAAEAEPTALLPSPLPADGSPAPGAPGPEAPRGWALGPQALTQPSSWPTLAARPLDERRLRHALAQLARGLMALHRAHKVHRDIKPSNILVTPEGRLVLLDFGILSDLEEQAAEPHPIIGTATYMAPEQTRGEAPSPAADWYSVGVLLYEALTGQPPFSGPAREVIERKRQQEPLPPQQWVEGLPEALCELCMELLRLDPARRPSGEEVLRRLGVEPSAEGELAWSTARLPFVGRAAELRALRDALADCRAGASVLVRVEGESGAGKSRLMRHFLEQLARTHEEVLVLSGRCYERESVPYKGVDGLIEGLARHLEGPGRAWLGAVLPPEAPTLACLFPVLQRVEGFEARPGAEARTAPHQLRLAAFEALRELLARLAARHPLVLAIDDLQWMDRDGLALLEKLVRLPRLLLVATVRQGSSSHSTDELFERSPWSEARLLQLRGLPLEEARSLVEHLLREQPQLAASQAQRIAQESGGSPLFIEALVHHPRPAQAQAPPRLEEALWARAQRLEPQAQGLLALLALATGPLRHALASHAVALTGAEYDRLVASLRAARLVITSGSTLSGSLELLHDRVRQAVLPQLSPVERQGWHARLATALEVWADQEAEALAHHWREAGQPSRAVSYYLVAARQAAQALAFSREASLYQKALELGRFSPEERRALQVARGEALSQAGQGRAAAHAFLEAAQGAAASEALALQRRAAERYLLFGHIDEGAALMGEVLDTLGVRTPSTPRGARLALRWERFKLRLSGFELREDGARALPPVLRERLEALGALSLGLSMVNPLRAASIHARYLRLALRAGEPHHLCRAIGFELSYLGWLGPHHRARLRRWEQVLEQLTPRLEGQGAALGLAAALRAWGRASLGEYAAARPHFERALELLTAQQGTHWEQSLTWAVGGGILSMMGELGQMRRRYERPLAEAWERKDLYALAALELGSATLRWLGADEPEQGRQAADAVFTLWSRQGYKMQDFGHLLSGLYVDLYQGQGEQVLRRLAEAWPQLEQAYLLQAPATGSRVLDLRMRACLMEAGRGGPGAPARLRQVEQDARVVARLGLGSARGMAELARAGLAAARGRPEAAGRYAVARGLLEDSGLLLHAMAARMRQGELLGGAEGARLVESAREWMHQRGIVRPERLSAMYAPAPGGA